MRGGATEVNETQKWATSKKRLRTIVLDNPELRKKTYTFRKKQIKIIMNTALQHDDLVTWCL
jgi:hypothetical protein